MHQPARSLAAQGTASSVCADKEVFKINKRGIVVGEAWADRNGQSCAEYAAFCVDGLPTQPHEFFTARLNKSLTALDACCVCNGGDALVCNAGVPTSLTTD